MKLKKENKNMDETIVKWNGNTYTHLYNKNKPKQKDYNIEFIPLMNTDPTTRFH